MIKFLCPNGHQLTAPDNLAGKTGKCPKCSTAFMVPTLEELAAANESPAEPAVDDPRWENNKDSLAGSKPTNEPAAEEKSAEKSGVGKAEGGKSGVGRSSIDRSTDGIAGVKGSSKISLGSSKGTGTPAAGVFVFLCPNGHKLNGPPSLKGKAGQCPHCGARFVIPEDDEVPPDDEIPTGAVDEEEEDVPAGEPVEDEVPAHADEEEVVEELEPDPEPIPAGVHALGYIVGRLWDHKTDTTELEIFLQEGEIISPDRYAEILSTGEYGVFAHKEAEENYSLSVIPWSAVRRIDLRRIPKLSSGTFR